MTPSERVPYEAMSQARHAQFDDAPGDSGAGGVPPLVSSVAEQSGTGPWGLGHGPWPLSEKHLTQPAYSKEFASKVGRWTAELDSELPHDPDALPYRKTEYHRCCDPDLCCKDPSYHAVQRMRNTFMKTFCDLAVGQVFLLVGAGAATRLCRCFMIALK
eukprot:7846615-Alexandrium_andersonii.AAC.1